MQTNNKNTVYTLLLITTDFHFQCIKVYTYHSSYHDHDRESLWLMQNRTSVWFFPFLCDQYCIQTMWTQLIKLNFCVSIFLALVITELPLIPNYFHIFPLRFTVLYPLVFRYFFSVSITLFYCFHFIFPSFFFFIFFLFNTPSIPFFNHPHFSSVIRRYPASDLLTPLNVYGCHGCLNMQISKSLVRDMFAWPDNLTWSHISCR